MKAAALLVVFAIFCGSVVAFADDDGQYSKTAIQGRRDYYDQQANKYLDMIRGGDKSADTESALQEAVIHRDASQQLLDQLNQPSTAGN